MKAGLVVTGVLGTGTVLVFALAGVVATLFPNGTLVNASWNGNTCMNCGGWGGAPVPPMVAPAPGVVFQGGVVNAGGSTVVTVEPVGSDGDIAPQP